jgi:two-component system, NarL family, sensor histidine kinase ComP
MQILKKNITLIILLAALIAASPFIYIQLNTVYLGIDVVKTSGGNWTVGVLDNQGYAARHEVQIGDRVVQVDGKDPGKHPSVKFNSI